jgi:hypothetical protein
VNSHGSYLGAGGGVLPLGVDHVDVDGKPSSPRWKRLDGYVADSVPGSRNDAEEEEEEAHLWLLREGKPVIVVGSNDLKTATPSRDREASERIITTISKKMNLDSFAGTSTRSCCPAYRTVLLVRGRVTIGFRRSACAPSGGCQKG